MPLKSLLRRSALCVWLVYATLHGPPVWAAAYDSKRVTIYIARRTWHIDVGFAVDEISGPLRRLANQFPSARYVFFGFGDRRYLKAKHHSGPVLIGAVLGGPGTILATGLGASPADAFGKVHVRQFALSGAEADSAQSTIWNSVEATDKTALVPKAGPYEGSLYFDSSRRYSGINTCNTWAARVLKSAGIPVRVEGTLFAGQLWRRLQRIQQGGFDPSWQTTVVVP